MQFKVDLRFYLSQTVVSPMVPQAPDKWLTWCGQQAAWCCQHGMLCSHLDSFQFILSITRYPENVYTFAVWPTKGNICRINGYPFILKSFFSFSRDNFFQWVLKWKWNGILKLNLCSNFAVTFNLLYRVFNKEGQKVKAYCTSMKGILGSIKGFILTQIY